MGGSPYGQSRVTCKYVAVAVSGAPDNPSVTDETDRTSNVYSTLLISGSVITTLRCTPVMRGVSSQFREESAA